MEFLAFLEQNREAILGEWFNRILKTYPPDASQFLAKQKDQFRNPVGHVITQAIGPIYDQVVSSMDTGKVLAALDGIIRIRSVQDFAPSDAVAFVFQLKSVIRDVLEGQIPEREQREGLAAIESRIDRVALLAFDKYTECREKVHEIKVKEIRNRSMRLIERVNAQSGIPQHKGESTDDGI